jgi:hypothetical protein
MQGAFFSESNTRLLTLNFETPAAKIQATTGFACGGERGKTSTVRGHNKAFRARPAKRGQPQGPAWAAG